MCLRFLSTHLLSWVSPIRVRPDGTVYIKPPVWLAVQEMVSAGAVSSFLLLQPGTSFLFISVAAKVTFAQGKGLFKGRILSSLPP